MVKFGSRFLTNLIAIMIFAASFLAGCADREDLSEAEAPDPALQRATGAFDQAQEALQRAELDDNLAFSDIGTLGNLAAILPDPLELGALEDQGAIQDAIGAFYSVLDGFGQQVAIAQAPAIPTQVELELSDSDLALVHIHLAYLYVVDAVRLLTREGWGKDGLPNTADDLFRVSFPDNPDFEDLDEVYRFELTERGQAKFDALAANPSTRPEDYLKEFRASQRQAVLDALVLLIGARVKILAFPDVIDIDGQPIQAQTPQVNRAICRQDALFHLEKAIDIAKQIAPDLEESLDEFSEIIAEAFAEDLLNQTSQWGFEVENMLEILDRINRLLGN